MTYLANFTTNYAHLLPLEGKISCYCCMETMERGNQQFLTYSFIYFIPNHMVDIEPQSARFLFDM